MSLNKEQTEFILYKLPIDGRLKNQDFHIAGSRIYCWKNKDKSYSLGINASCRK